MWICGCSCIHFSLQRSHHIITCCIIYRPEQRLSDINISTIADPLKFRSLLFPKLRLETLTFSVIRTFLSMTSVLRHGLHVLGFPGKLQLGKADRFQWVSEFRKNTRTYVFVKCLYETLSGFQSQYELWHWMLTPTCVKVVTRYYKVHHIWHLIHLLWCSGGLVRLLGECNWFLDFLVCIGMNCFGVESEINYILTHSQLS